MSDSLAVYFYSMNKLDTNSGQTWTPRRANILVQDTLFENMVGAPPFITVANQSELIARVVDSIRRGELLLVIIIKDYDLSQEKYENIVTL